MLSPFWKYHITCTISWTIKFGFILPYQQPAVAGSNPAISSRSPSQLWRRFCFSCAFTIPGASMQQPPVYYVLYYCKFYVILPFSILLSSSGKQSPSTRSRKKYGEFFFPFSSKHLLLFCFSGSVIWFRLFSVIYITISVIVFYTELFTFSTWFSTFIFSFAFNHFLAFYLFFTISVTVFYTVWKIRKSST